MPSQKISHPASTNFDEDDILRQAKRLKRIQSFEEDSTSHGVSEAESLPITPGPRDLKEIPDSEEELDSEKEDQGDHRLTELEEALPFVKTDKEAIAEYESHRFGTRYTPETLKRTFDQRTWTRGKSSIYVDAFNLALETVLEDEGHLFDEAEQEVFKQWRLLDYEAQYLYVRLFLRKTSAWHRINRLGYYSDIADLPAAVECLQVLRDLPLTTPTLLINPGEDEAPDGSTLTELFKFADTSEECITTMKEASSLLSLDELKIIAKEAKIQGKNKSDLLKALRRMSGKQMGLGWVGLKRSDSEMTTISNGSGLESEETDTTGDGYDDINRDKHFLRKIMSMTGPCIRLYLPILRLFERVLLVFYRSTEWTDKSLTTIILASISRRTFPEYIVSRSTNIFSSRAELLEFEAAIRTQFHVDNILEGFGNATPQGLQKVIDIFEEVYPRWKILLEEEQRKEDRLYETGEGAYLRRFSPAWVYTRIVHKGASVLGRFKQHLREHSVLSELLNQTLFHSARRGAWYTRKALLEEHYMCSLLPSPLLSSPEAQKRHWKRLALATCESGLQDRDTHLIYHHDLQKRIRKLEKSLKVAMRQQHDFGHVSLATAMSVSISGIQIIHNHLRPPSRGKNGELRNRSTKTIWLDEAEGGGECGVEAMCLSAYRAQGWKGFHAEGAIVRTLFAYLFFDVLFAYVPNVFQTAFQTCPLDLHSDAFYPARISEVNARLVEIANGGARDIVLAVDGRERERKTCVVGLNWDFELADLLEIVECFEGEALATICKVMAQEYRQRSGGIPDLFLWRMSGGEDKGEVMFAEVKSENDRLSDTQRLWIDVLTGAGVRVELCNAVAKETRVVDVS